MTVLKALVTVVGTAVAFAIAGGAIGFGLGKVAPGYFRHVFRVQDNQTFNPEELGLGLGVTQGLIWGIVVGLGVVLIVAWYQTCIARLGKDDKRP